MNSLKFEHVIEEVVTKYPADQRRMLKKLTGVKLSKAEVTKVWLSILEHKWYLSERLRRDVGLKTAAIDFFENIQSPPSTPKIFNPTSLAAFEHAMRGTRSLAR